MKKISEELHISEGTVWNYLKKLEGEKMKIQASKINWKPMYEAIEKLKAYERIGLEPEEVQNLKEQVTSESELGERQAIKLLRDNGYIVTKWTREMEADANECDRMGEKGRLKDCSECSCSVCLIQ